MLLQKMIQKILSNRTVSFVKIKIFYLCGVPPMIVMHDIKQY